MIKKTNRDETLATLKEIANSYFYKGKDRLLELENIGLQVIPFTFYSPIPSVSDIEEGWETQNFHPFFEPEIYDNDDMMEFLTSALMPYSDEFNPKKEGKEGDGDFYWNNPSFSHSDALSLYCFVRHLKPKRVLEIGGGFSTLVIDQAIKKNGSGEIWEVEPYPKQFLKKLTTISRFYENPVQKIPLTLFDELKTGDILFIDSTHTVKASSDCTFIYLKGLKRLKEGVFIHSHDIFLPNSIPIHWNIKLHIYWTEHYLLQALLIENPRYRVIYGSNYHRIFNKELLDKFMNGKAHSLGGSFWYIRV